MKPNELLPPPSETREELTEALQQIEAWEQEQKDLWFWEKLGRLPFALLDRLTPKFVQEKLGQAVNELGSYIQNGGQYLISERSVLEKLEQNRRATGTHNGVPLSAAADVSFVPLAIMDRTAAELGDTGTRLATVQGATTGFGGLFTLALDIPAVIGLSLKVIQEMAVCYGYDPKEKNERIFAVKCMQFASSDIVGKQAILAELSAFGRTDGHAQVISQLQGWREVIQIYRDNFGWKKLFQLIPVAGMLFGAFINRSTLQDVSEAAMMLYRKRRVQERLSRLEPKL
ncbi:EcsC family protein [Paenibacillus ginsengihumi]|uniref:EcsC family protein n=1 Tax=Paenibacillus ginsengihumi TaxID=431596 RepID=UPI00035FF327|nr:EcsC family protein [Paenibacillus ginsengihumi]